MRAFHLVVHGLAQIMQQPRPLGFLHVKTKFRGHDAAQKSHFQGMLKHILGEAGPEPELSQKTYDFRMNAVHAQIKGGLLYSDRKSVV